MQKCKIIQGYGAEALEYRINAWIAAGNGIGMTRIIHSVSYQKDGVYDRALIIYEDKEMRDR